MKIKLPLLSAAVLSIALGAAPGVQRSAGPSADTLTSVASSSSKWPGHRPGKVVLGMSCGGSCPAKERQLGQNYGVHRQFTAWGAWDDVVRKIRADHAQGRVPWISVKGPNGGASGWRALASRRLDKKVRALASDLKANDSRPVILTFHHEPSNDGSEAAGADWAHASNRFRNVLNKEGALANVAYAPIVGDWLFNPRNKGQNPANWVRNGVLKRADFLGIDLYENDSGETFAQRLPRVLSWMRSRGFPNKMIGIGEMGGTDSRYAGKSAVAFINESLTWAAKNTDKIGVVSYFNSTANSRSKVYWPLDESSTKLNTYRHWLGRAEFAS